MFASFVGTLLATRYNRALRCVEVASDTLNTYPDGIRCVYLLFVHVIYHD